MPELESVLYTRLSTYANLIALTSTRIYPIIMPQNPTLPAVTYQRVDTTRGHMFDGDDGLPHPTIQIDSWAKTYAGAKAVATQVRGALQRWASEATDPVVLDSLIEGDGDEYDPDANLFHVRQAWVIWHRE